MNFALLVNLLAPYLPGLMGLGKTAAGKAAEKAGETAGEQSAAVANKIWQRLWPKVEAKEAAKEAAEDVAKDPTDADSVTALRRQLKKILESDAGLAAEVEALLKAAEANAGGTRVQQTVTGDGNQVIGTVGDSSKVFGDVTGDVTVS